MTSGEYTCATCHDTGLLHAAHRCPDGELRCRDCAACPVCRTDDPPDVCPWSVEDESPAELIAGAVVLAVGLYGWAVGVML